MNCHDQRPADLAGIPNRLRQATPEAIVAADELTRAQKIALLREQSYDARELAVASEEGMAAAPARDDAEGRLQRILHALQELGADPEASGGKQG